jgi:hypothetical protein
MAGPGLDIIVYPLVFIWSFILLLKYLYKAINTDKSFWTLFFIHFIGLTSLLIFVSFF